MSFAISVLTTYAPVVLIDLVGSTSQVVRVPHATALVYGVGLLVGTFLHTLTPLLASA